MICRAIRLPRDGEILRAVDRKNVKHPSGIYLRRRHGCYTCPYEGFSLAIWKGSLVAKRKNDKNLVWVVPGISGWPLSEGDIWPSTHFGLLGFDPDERRFYQVNINLDELDRIFRRSQFLKDRGLNSAGT